MVLPMPLGVIDGDTCIGMLVLLLLVHKLPALLPVLLPSATGASIHRYYSRLLNSPSTLVL